MSQLFLPLILFLGFIGFRVASVVATRKRETQLRAAWRAEVEATRVGAADAVRELRAPLVSLLDATARLQAMSADRAPAERAELDAIAAAGRALAARTDGLLTALESRVPQ